MIRPPFDLHRQKSIVSNRPAPENRRGYRSQFWKVEGVGKRQASPRKSSRGSISFLKGEKGGEKGKHRRESSRGDPSHFWKVEGGGGKASINEKSSRWSDGDHWFSSLFFVFIFEMWEELRERGYKLKA